MKQNSIQRQVTPEKARLSQQLQRDIDAFIQQGGTIEVIHTAQEMQRRRYPIDTGPDLL